MNTVKEAYAEYYKTNDFQKSSEIIYSHFTGINDNIFSSSGNKARIHFHLPPAQSFCRCWSDVRGDDISSFRQSVLDISKHHEIIKGIETGRGGFVIRGIAPIFSESGDYYGSVEAFFNVNHLLDEVSCNTSGNFAILMDKNLLERTTNFLEDSSSNIYTGNQIVGEYILVDKTYGFNLSNLISDSIISLHPQMNIERDHITYSTIAINNING